MKALLRGLTDRDAANIGADPSWLAKLAKPGGDSLVLEKTWHVIHFLLCGKAWDGPEPLRHALLGGVEVGQDFIHVLGPEPASRVAKALAEIPPGTLLAEFQRERLEAAEIYPGGWLEAGQTADWAAWIRADYESLRGFYARRAELGEAVLIRIA